MRRSLTKIEMPTNELHHKQSQTQIDFLPVNSRNKIKSVHFVVKHEKHNLRQNDDFH